MHPDQPPRVSLMDKPIRRRPDKIPLKINALGIFCPDPAEMVRASSTLLMDMRTFGPKDSESRDVADGTRFIPLCA